MGYLHLGRSVHHALSVGAWHRVGAAGLSVYMSPLTQFLVVGLLTFCPAAAGSRLAQANPTQIPKWMWSGIGRGILLNGSFLIALGFFAVIIYGFTHLDWWIPLVSIFIGFPAVFAFIVTRILGDIWTILIFGPLGVVSIIYLALNW